MKLPSKKLIFLFIACFISLGSILWALNSGPDQKKSVKNSADSSDTQNLVAITPTATDIDSDKDGLKDWEEVLWKTDPRNPDTNRNGVKDGAETVVISQKQSSETDSKTDTAAFTLKNQTPGNVTDGFAREVFSKYMELKQGGTQLSASSIDELAKNFIANSDSLDLKPLSYKETDFTPIVNEKTEDIRAYGNELGRILNVHSPRTKENELYIFLYSLQNNDEKKIADLDPIIKGYRNVINDAARMRVPESALAIHADLLTSMAAVEKTIEGMRKIYTDPIVAIPSMNAYPETIADMGVSFRAIIGYFGQKNIAFSKTESGYNLINTL